jgi:hypothetical protein
MFSAAHLKPIAMTSSGGNSATSGAGGLRVPQARPRRRGAGAAAAEEAQIAKELEHTPALLRELLEFKMKIDP